MWLAGQTNYNLTWKTLFNIDFLYTIIMNINTLNQQEQESIAAFTVFWKRWGLQISTFVFAVLLGFAAWSGYGWYKNHQATQAIDLYAQVLRNAQQSKIEPLTSSFNALKTQYPNTMQAQQAALLVGRILYDKGNLAESQTALAFAASNASNLNLQSAARIQLAGILIEQKKYDAALAQVNSNIIPSYAALAADRKGDIYALQHKGKEAIAAYSKAHRAIAADQPYQQLIALKLSRLGVNINATPAPETPTGMTKK